MVLNAPKYYRKVCRALPSYYGGKRRLLPYIFSAIKIAYGSKDHYSLSSFMDVFSGGGSVSLYAKLMNFYEIICNDRSKRAQIVAEGLIENKYTYIEPITIARLLQESETGYIREKLSGKVFSHRHAEILDRISVNKDQLECETQRALATLLLWHLAQEFVAFGASIGTSNRPFAEVLDGQADWWGLNPKRLNDRSFGKLLRPVEDVIQHKVNIINQGIFSGYSNITRCQYDAVNLLDWEGGCDVLYLDPPYAGTLDYEKQNNILDKVLFGPGGDPLPPSDFTKDPNAIHHFLKRDDAETSNVWVISYGNQVISLDELIAMVQDASPQRLVRGWALDYKHLAHVSKNNANQELLVIAVDPDCIKDKERFFNESL